MVVLAAAAIVIETLVAVLAVLVTGLVFLGGLVVYIWSFFVPGEKNAREMPPVGANAGEGAAAEAAA